MPEHSPEPWTFSEDDGGLFCVRDADGYGVFGEEIGPRGPRDEPVARRIVACVNACGGIPTELLEENAPGDVISCARDSIRCLVDLAIQCPDLNEGDKRVIESSITCLGDLEGEPRDSLEHIQPGYACNQKSGNWIYKREGWTAERRLERFRKIAEALRALRRRAKAMRGSASNEPT
jgi:hypothetical protein